MDKDKINQMAKEMTELCNQKARSAYLFAGTPAGKAIFLVVLTLLVEITPGDDRFWWKPPTT